MSATLALKKDCTRCPRVEERVVSLEEATRLLEAEKKGSNQADVVVIYEGSELVRFNYLCDSCREFVAKTLTRVCRNLEQKSPVFDPSKPRKRRSVKKEASESAKG